MQVWTSTLISKQGYPFKDILQWISVEHEYPRMDIYVFMGISLQLSMLLLVSIWISNDIYGYPMHILAKDSLSRVFTPFNNWD